MISNTRKAGKNKTRDKIEKKKITQHDNYISERGTNVSFSVSPALFLVDLDHPDYLFSSLIFSITEGDIILLFLSEVY